MRLHNFSAASTVKSMKNRLPAMADVAARMREMSARQIQLLALLSGVPEHTLLKVRNGQTLNPRYKTVYAIMPLMRRVVAEVA